MRRRRRERRRERRRRTRQDNPDEIAKQCKTHYT
jgi:hypothetical protein